MNKRKRIALIVCAGIAVTAAAVGGILFGGGHSTSASPNSAIEPLEDNSAEVEATIPGFHRLNPDYVRGSQPSHGGARVLRRLGVRTIVDLRSSYDHTEDVRESADRLGLAYYWMPMSVWDPPTDDQANEFVRLVSDDSKAPFFVFCADGLNRTGMMSAIYRVMHDQWSTDKALKEMDELGFNPYYWSLRQYVWTYARKFRPEAVPPEGRAIVPAGQYRER